jgi:hypothetical protein
MERDCDREGLTQSVLCVPVKDINGEVLGVVQVVNKKPTNINERHNHLDSLGMHQHTHSNRNTSSLNTPPTRSRRLRTNAPPLLSMKRLPVSLSQSLQPKPPSAAASFVRNSVVGGSDSGLPGEHDELYVIDDSDEEDDDSNDNNNNSNNNNNSSGNNNRNASPTARFTKNDREILSLLTVHIRSTIRRCLTDALLQSDERTVGGNVKMSIELQSYLDMFAHSSQGGETASIFGGSVAEDDDRMRLRRGLAGGSGNGNDASLGRVSPSAQSRRGSRFVVPVQPTYVWPEHR